METNEALIFTLQYRDEHGVWEAPGDPSACVFESEEAAGAAGDCLRLRCPEYRDCALRVIDSNNRTVTEWTPFGGVD